MIVEQMFPLKVITSLLDKPEVGPLVVENVLVSVFRYVLLYTCCYFLIKMADCLRTLKIKFVLSYLPINSYSKFSGYVNYYVFF